MQCYRKILHNMPHFNHYYPHWRGVYMCMN